MYARVRNNASLLFSRYCQGRTFHSRKYAFVAETPFHGDNTGSNPVGDAKIPKHLRDLVVFPEGLKRFDKKLGKNLRLFSQRQNHLDQLRLRGTLQNRLARGFGLAAGDLLLDHERVPALDIETLRSSPSKARCCFSSGSLSVIVRPATRNFLAHSDAAPERFLAIFQEALCQGAGR